MSHCPFPLSLSPCPAAATPLPRCPLLAVLRSFVNLVTGSSEVWEEAEKEEGRREFWEKLELRRQQRRGD